MKSSIQQFDIVGGWIDLSHILSISKAKPDIAYCCDAQFSIQFMFRNEPVVYLLNRRHSKCLSEVNTDDIANLGAAEFTKVLDARCVAALQTEIDKLVAAWQEYKAQELKQCQS